MRDGNLGAGLGMRKRGMGGNLQGPGTIVPTTHLATAPGGSHGPHRPREVASQPWPFACVSRESRLEAWGGLAGPQLLEHHGTLQSVLEWGRTSEPPLCHLRLSSGQTLGGAPTTGSQWPPESCGVNHSSMHPLSRCVLSPTLAGHCGGGMAGTGHTHPAAPPTWGAREAGPGERSERPSSAQGDMEQALENYDVCTELLQGAAASGAEQGGVVVRLPNLHNDSVVSLEEVSRASSAALSRQRPDLSVWARRWAGG